MHAKTILQCVIIGLCLYFSCMLYSLYYDNVHVTALSFALSNCYLIKHSLSEVNRKCSSKQLSVLIILAIVLTLHPFEDYYYFQIASYVLTVTSVQTFILQEGDRSHHGPINNCDHRR